MVKEYEKFALDTKGIFRSGAVDCDDFKAICDKEGVTEFPTMKMYPPFPVPASNLDLAGGFQANKLKKKMAKYISDKSIVITSNNIKTFVDESPSTPKVLLFTSAKKGTPFMYKALSQHFEVSPPYFILNSFLNRKPCNLVLSEKEKIPSMVNIKSRVSQLF